MSLPLFLEFPNAKRLRFSSARSAEGVYSVLLDTQIRLLTIKKSTSGKLITRLKVYDFDSLPEFHALSYTWGSSSRTETILCNGEALEIGANLHEALQTLYSLPLQHELPIWIDAICIDQRNDDEKGHQVQCMGNIYRKAHLVVVWLGPSANGSDAAMDWMEPLGKALQLIPKVFLNTELSAQGLPAYNDPLWLALQHLYRREWFGRLWTFQEVVLGVNIKIVCGQKSVDGELFGTVAEEINRLAMVDICLGDEDIPKFENGFHAMLNVNFARRTLRDDGYLNLSALLDVADTKLVTDARDRVYGMLGLTSETLRRRISVSYVGQAFQVYIDCAKACIEEGAGSQILKLVTGRLKQPGLPSWCPNLDSVEGPISRFEDHLQAGIHRYSHENSPPRCEMTISEKNILSITGFQAGTVADIVDGTLHRPVGPYAIFLHQNLLDWEARCFELARRTYKSQDGSPPISHLHTLTGNTRGRIPKEQDNAIVDAYLDVMANQRSLAQGNGAVYPPADRETLSYEFWLQMVTTCVGRRYFSTESGQVGLGPPDMQKGDSVCIFYDSGPAFVLRRANKDGGEGWLLQGDAYLYGFMELDETPMSDRGADEVFNIF